MKLNPARFEFWFISSVDSAVMITWLSIIYLFLLICDGLPKRWIQNHWIIRFYYHLNCVIICENGWRKKPYRNMGDWATAWCTFGCFANFQFSRNITDSFDFRCCFVEQTLFFGFDISCIGGVSISLKMN